MMLQKDMEMAANLRSSMWWPIISGSLASYWKENEKIEKN